MNRTSTRPLRPRATLVVAGTVALAALLAGCGAGSAASASSSTSKAPASSSNRPARGGFGGVSGSIASVGSGSFTVKPSTGSTDTVNWTSSTAFTRTAVGALTDVTAGTCVSVSEASGSDASTGSVDATAVRITPAENGSCTRGGGFGGGSGSRPSGGFGGGSRPSGGFRGGAGGSGAPGGGFARAMLFGSVASTSPSGFVVNVTTPGTSGSSASTTTTAVAVSSSTTYSVTSAASATDLAVGECAAVFSGRTAGASGSAAPTSAPSTGPVTAAAVTLSQPVNGACSAGFGGFGGGGGTARSGSASATA